MSYLTKYADAFANPKGPGDARPTALDIVKEEGLLDKLSGKVFLVTGASSGIGVETVRALHNTGADVFFTVRDVPKGEQVKADILAKSEGHGNLQVLRLELDSLSSVKDCVADFLSKSKQLNVLITNAGVMACPEGTTKDGFETQFGTNHLGHFLLFELLKLTLLASSTPDFNSRVVSLSSSAHNMSGVHLDDLDLKKMGYEPWTAYGQAKTANIYMATEIERRYGSQGLHANAVMPGGIWTPLQRHLPAEVLASWDKPEFQANMKSTEQGAATSVWAAIAKEWEGKGGKYLEDCRVAAPKQDGAGLGFHGHAPYAYDGEAAKKLWEISLKLVGLEDEK